MPVCPGCGGSYSDEFNFCNYCGRAKPETNSLKIQVSISSEDRWEICKTTFIVVEKAKGVIYKSLPKLQWVAKASGPNGQYIAAESPVFEGFPFPDQQPFSFNTPDNIANTISGVSKAVNEKNTLNRKLLDDLINKLLKDGWDCISDSNGINKQFRRRAK